MGQSIRIYSVDVLRGLVMVIMALDHVRQFMGLTSYAPEDLSSSSPELFLTRWITHFCAPVFVLLAGTSAFLYQYNSRCSNKKLSRFLLKRGIWIIFIEIFIFNLIIQAFPYNFLILQVLWAIGWSMIFLSFVVFLPGKWILVIGFGLIFFHNLLDGIHSESLPGFLSTAWIILHESHRIFIKGFPVYFHYPLIPWLGVMACGYLLGKVLVQPVLKRDKLLKTIGLALIISFVSFRILNIYGDPNQWSMQDRGPLFTFLSFLNTTKYPPSLLFLSMTLGPAIFLMPWMERWSGKWVEFFNVYGKVPFFYYLLHFVVIHIIAYIWSMANFGYSGWWFGPTSQHPEGYEMNLWWIYGCWIAVVLLIFPVCRWYMYYKMANKMKWWLSYV